jgi:methylglutaconyl-CoA hydratase
MTAGLVKVFRSAPQVMELTLNRPKKRNALSILLMQELLQQLRGFSTEIRLLILKGEGDFFCAGLDLEEAHDPAKHEIASALVAETLQTLAELPCVTIAYIKGGALAGGLGLVAACDITLASSEALFSLPELRRGLIPALVSTLLKRQVPLRFLNELVLTGEPITAIRAHALGLINHVVKRDEVEELISSLTESILKAAPEALRFYKKQFMQPEKEAFTRALALHRQIRSSPEAEEGIRAFLEKRSPDWLKSP